MRVLTVLTLTALTCFAWAGPHLPWPESYFFPIGSWLVPTNDESDWLNYDDETGKTIDDWQPPDYSSMLDLKLDYARIYLGMTTSAREIENIPFDVDSDGVPFEPLTVRPSDGIAIAVRVGCDIEIADEIVPKLTLYGPDEIPFRKLALSEIDKL